MSRCWCKLFQRLVEAGNTIVVIEHNLEVIKCADWIIDLGPEAGDEGGKSWRRERRKQLAKVEKSHTGRFLRDVLRESDACSPRIAAHRRESHSHRR